MYYPWKTYEPPYSPSYELNSTTIVLFRRDLALNEPRNIKKNETKTNQTKPTKPNKKQNKTNQTKYIYIYIYIYNNKVRSTT